MSHHIKPFELLAVEFRVLPFHRFVLDRIYWGWVCFWFAVLPPLAALTHIPFMAGCQGYFEWRDICEFPAIHRWSSRRWLHHRKSL